MNPLLMAMQGLGQATTLVQAIQAYKNGTLEQLAQKEMQNNPKFREFVEANRGKSQEQIAQEMGVDLGKLKSMM